MSAHEIASHSKVTSLRLAEKHTAKKLADFAQEMWLAMGARMLFFVSFKRPNGKIACTQLDFNDTLGNGKSYLTANASFQSAGITSRDWLQHNTTYYEPDQDVPTFSTYRPRRGLMELTTNQYGEPVLPDPEVVPSGMKGRAYWQGLLRAFLALHYGIQASSHGMESD